MPTADDFRALALALPGAVEGSHHGHPDFRANGRVFASLHPDGKQVMVRVAPEQQRTLVRAAPAAFAPASGAWGRAGCTMVALAAAPRDAVADALRDAWQVANAQPAARRKPASGTPKKQRNRGAGRTTIRARKPATKKRR